MAVLEIIDNSSQTNHSNNNTLDEWIPQAQPAKQLVLNEKALCGFAGEFVYETVKLSVSEFRPIFHAAKSARLL